MTPFDPSALVAMLRAFYPTPSGAALATARRERPEYFAGGTLFGSKGDKLRLPDGREWDCIVAAGGPVATRSWQCAFIDPTDPGVVDPFPLEAGPLDPLDEEQEIFVGGDPSLETVVAEQLGALDGADGVLAASAATALDFDGADAVDHDFRATIEPAIEAHAGVRAALNADDLGDVLDTAGQQEGVIDAGREDYVEPAPDDTAEPDPGNPPGDEDGDKEPPEK